MSKQAIGVSIISFFLYLFIDYGGIYSLTGRMILLIMLVFIAFYEF